MNLKKKVLMLTSVVLVLGLASMGIMAYLTDQDSARNVFTVGSIDIELEEEVGVVGSGDVVETQDGASYTGVMPGDELQKEVTVSNVGNNDAYVRVLVNVNNADKINASIDNVYENAPYNYTEEQIQAVYDEVFEDWGLKHTKKFAEYTDNVRLTIVDPKAPISHVDTTQQLTDYSRNSIKNWFMNEGEEDGYMPGLKKGYYSEDMGQYEYCWAYYMYLKPGEEVTLFDGLNVPAYFDADQLAMFEDLVIDVKAEAIQAANIGTGKDKADFVRAFELFEDPTAHKAITNSEELADAIANGEAVYLNKDLVAEEFVVEAGKSADIDLNNNKLDGKINNKGDLEVSNGTVEADYINNYGDATFTDVEIKAGTATDYAVIGREGSETTYNNVDVTAVGGGIGVTDGAEVVFNSGSLVITGNTTNPRYNFYVVGAGSEVTINGGEFDFTAKTLKRAYIYADAGTIVNINGGVFGTASTRSGYTAGILGSGKVIIKGGTFGFDPTKWVAEGYEAVKDGSVWNVVAK